MECPRRTRPKSIWLIFFPSKYSHALSRFVLSVVFTGAFQVVLFKGPLVWTKCLLVLLIMHLKNCSKLRWYVQSFFFHYSQFDCRFLCLKVPLIGQLLLLKFVFFEEATKFDKISILLLTNKFMFFVSRYSFEHQSGSQSWNFIH